MVSYNIVCCCCYCTHIICFCLNMEKHPRKVFSGHLSLYIVLLRTRLVNLSCIWWWWWWWGCVCEFLHAQIKIFLIKWSIRASLDDMEISFQLFVDANKDIFVLMFENLLAKTQQAVIQNFMQNDSKKSLRSSLYGARTLDVKAKTGSLFGSFSMKEIFHNVNTVINSKRLIFMGLMKY